MKGKSMCKETLMKGVYMQKSYDEGVCLQRSFGEGKYFQGTLVGGQGMPKSLDEGKKYASKP